MPIVVLVSGTGSTLQALIQACADPAYGARIAAVGADRPGIQGLTRAQRAGLPTFVQCLAHHPDRDAWDRALAADIARHAPVLVVTAGFMRLLGPAVLDRFTVLNTHPALLPAFPGAHAVHDALAHGVRVTGCTVHLVDAGVDTGAIIEQRAVDVLPGDTEHTLHERIKAVERPLLVDTVGRMVRLGHRVADRKVTIP